jgi:hypothetical protein
MKKIAIILFCVVVVIMVFPDTARADIGPKPSVVIDFNGLERKTYYATLLSSEKSTRPFSALSTGNHTYIHYQEGMKIMRSFRSLPGTVMQRGIISYNILKTVL